MEMEQKYNTRNPVAAWYVFMRKTTDSFFKASHKSGIFLRDVSQSASTERFMIMWLSIAVKRLMREACELSEPTDEYFARPLEDNLFEWHFTVHGSPGTEFEGGVYHGRILLPAEYPMKPPNIILLTPNGRFETNKKICLSISGHHPETWQPSWSIRTALLALIAFMSSPGNGAIGSLEYTAEERKLLAKKSRHWECTECGKIVSLLSSAKSQPVTKEESDLINRIAMKAEDAGKKDSESSGEQKELSKMLDDPKRPASESLHSARQQPETVNLVELSENDKWRSVMWGVVATIFLLVARRLFLM